MMYKNWLPFLEYLVISEVEMVSALVGHLAVVVALFYLVQLSLVSLVIHLHIAYSDPPDEARSQTRGHRQCKSIDQPKESIENNISMFKYIKYFQLLK